MKSILGDTIDGSHNGIVSKLSVFRTIMYELFFVKRKTLKPICKNSCVL